ncbi:Predicted tubulin-tyrosine ligase [Plasmopara halstedii]|uniref:Predicted tubulin-tyrosine ligase n=1 Tax=Plasmopara halstedii TaxID=4781 RepID=A0A0P1AGI9_PLAHL|nr:Predicted tubulin-tyrosine ligase [Plasmopara halstedii]CEG39583.1 Predicted tubulin-tyrosine ligase [Plasmopara halstedii]|eukprot:XP_024575952.1 Predicted tubulin-tyrosine ligase [Plasmopara halstedii]
MPAQLYAVDDKFPDVVAELEARGWRRLPFVSCPKFDLKWTNYAKIAWKQKNQLAQLLYNQRAQIQVDHWFPRTFDMSISEDILRLKFWFRYVEAVKILQQSFIESMAIDEQKFQVVARDNFAASPTLGLQLKKLSFNQDRRCEIQEILTQLEQRDPQFLTVCRDDSNVWICKPSNLSQGRGIVLCNTSEDMEKLLFPDKNCAVNSDEIKDRSMIQTKWMVQKYIERPLLLQNGRKFDIRQWVLITALKPDPIVFWFFKSYLRFCSRKFNLAHLHDQFVHLSNYSVQQHFARDVEDDSRSNQDEDVNAFEPMWSSEQFQDMLRQQHGNDVWSETIVPQMQSIVQLTLDAVLPRLEVVGQGFEWLGYDFLVDENNHVWLLEVNVSPDMSHSTKITAELVPKATADALSVILDTESSRSSENGWLPFPLRRS